MRTIKLIHFFTDNVSVIAFSSLILISTILDDANRMDKLWYYDDAGHATQILAYDEQNYLEAHYTYDIAGAVINTVYLL